MVRQADRVKGFLRRGKKNRSIFLSEVPGAVPDSSSELWWKRGPIYEIYLRSFADANGDGVGDLAGITSRLDYLNDGTPNSLGVDAIWITPFYPSPMFDFGYDVSDYCGVDPLFGSMSDFDLLLAEAHKRGIRVIIDMVFNHTSHRHPWFIESRSSRDNPRSDWYIWRDKSALGRRPNNWKSVFGGPAWAWEEARQQYYLHLFLKEQPDLNWRNPEVRRAIHNVVRFWLDRGVDGLRLDVINLIFKHAELRDNPRRFGRRPYEMLRHIYDQDQPETHEALRELRSLIDGYGERMMVGEISLDPPQDARVAASYYGCNDELNLAFNFSFSSCPWNARAFRSEIDKWERALPPNAWPNYVLSNHDLPRHIQRFGRGELARDRARVAAMMLLTLRGTPFLYYGEEIGMSNGSVPRWRMQDPVGKRYWPLHPGRDEERTPMQWDASPGAGFTTGPHLWLPLAGDFRAVNVQNQLHDPGSLLSLYRRLIWLRKSTPALISGSYRPEDGVPDDCLVYRRETETQRLLIALNFANLSRMLPVPPEFASAKMLISTDAKRGAGVVDGLLKLRPNEGCIVMP